MHSTGTFGTYTFVPSLLVSSSHRVLIGKAVIDCAATFRKKSLQPDSVELRRLFQKVTVICNCSV